MIYWEPRKSVINTEDTVNMLLELGEDYWKSLIHKARERGFTEEDVEQAIEDLKEELALEPEKQTEEPVH